MISVIIPTYKEPDVLDLCIKSALEGQVNTNEIIVIVDGFYDINKDVLLKYNNKIKIIELSENYGLCRATNIGVFNASNDLVLVVNDDNVFPSNWDINLENAYSENSVLTPNQIEPIPSMFKQFHIANLGRDPNTFNLDFFRNYEISILEDKIEHSGSTLPFLINKYDYLKVGGWDENYSGGWVADWEFFMKCEMIGMKMIRTYKCHFYHFVSIGTKSNDRLKESQEKEYYCHEYFKYKWGQYAKHNPINNSKLLK